MDQGCDNWDEAGASWIRHHDVPRSLQYHPAIDVVLRLEEKWVTFKVLNDGRDYHIEDSSTDTPWTGRTVFYELGCYPQVHAHDAPEESRGPRQASIPKGPTPEERELHNLTHLTYRPWCRVCLKPKPRGNYHKQQYDRRPLLQEDCGLLVEEATKQYSLVLSCIDVTTGMAGS